MNAFRYLRRGRGAALTTCAFALGLTPLAYGAALGDVLKTSGSWLVAEAQSQDRVDSLDDERRAIEEEYRTTLRESDGLRLYIQQLAAQLTSQREEMETVKQEARDIERTSVEIVPLMRNMLVTLEEFIKLDMPFLLNERLQRVRHLNDMMPRADVTVSEKYRRIVEAYQIEMEFGRTIEAYKADLEGREMDFLLVGRVALLYQTPDGDQTGFWDATKKEWVKDNGYSGGRKQTSPDLLIVPIQAAKKGGGS